MTLWGTIAAWVYIRFYKVQDGGIWAVCRRRAVLMGALRDTRRPLRDIQFCQLLARCHPSLYYPTFQLVFQSPRYPPNMRPSVGRRAGRIRPPSFPFGGHVYHRRTRFRAQKVGFAPYTTVLLANFPTRSIYRALALKALDARLQSAPTPPPPTQPTPMSIPVAPVQALQKPEVAAPSSPDAPADDSKGPHAGDAE